MNQVSSSALAEAKDAIAQLIQQKPPILVEIRFPNAATAPDWRLCEDEDQLDQVLERLGPGAELHISSVWDLKNVKGEICLTK